MKSLFKLRDYQTALANKAVNILNEYKIVYMAMEVRTGKSCTSMEVCRLYGAKRVLFITKKLAFKSVEEDYTTNFGFSEYFVLDIINKESLHKLERTDYDVVIIDEAHEFGAYPKPGKYQKMIKDLFGRLPMIYLSGTPHPESFCQLYHQFEMSDASPWRMYSKFYAWHGRYGIPKVRHLGALKVPDYSDCKRDEVLRDVAHLMLSFTQEEAGFTTSVNINKVYHRMGSLVEGMIKKLRDDKILRGQSGKVIIADSGAKMMSKVHQLSSGTCKADDGSVLLLDYSKAEFIRDYFAGNKLAIFYYFQGELDILRAVFGDTLTTCLDEFNTSSKHFAVQQARGAKGISLKAADKLVFYNFGFSNEKYIQAIDRLTTMDRLTNDVYFVINPKGIDSHVFASLESKKDYILSAFKKDIKKC